MSHPNVEPAVAPSAEYELIKDLHRIAKAGKYNAPFFPDRYFPVMAAAEEYLRSQERAPIYKDELPHR